MSDTHALHESIARGPFGALVVAVGREIERGAIDARSEIGDALIDALDIGGRGGTSAPDAIDAIAEIRAKLGLGSITDGPRSESLVEMATENMEPVKWVAMMLTKGTDHPPKNRGEAMDWIESIVHQGFARMVQQSADGWRGAGAMMITQERQRQIVGEWWSAEHDDAHSRGELADAAACYLFCGVAETPEDLDDTDMEGDPKVPEMWPFEPSAWKPKDAIRNLVVAGALIAAEIDRMARIDNQRGGVSDLET